MAKNLRVAFAGTAGTAHAGGFFKSPKPLQLLQFPSRRLPTRGYGINVDAAASAGAPTCDPARNAETPKSFWGTTRATPPWPIPRFTRILYARSWHKGPYQTLQGDSNASRP